MRNVPRRTALHAAFFVTCLVGSLIYLETRGRAAGTDAATVGEAVSERVGGGGIDNATNEQKVVIERFARGTVAGMTGVEEWSEEAMTATADSITVLIALMAEDGNWTDATPPTDLEAVFSPALKDRSTQLAAVDAAYLERDWAEVREKYRAFQDRKTAVVREALERHPVLLVSVQLNLHVAHGGNRQPTPEGETQAVFRGAANGMAEEELSTQARRLVASMLDRAAERGSQRAALIGNVFDGDPGDFREVTDEDYAALRQAIEERFVVEGVMIPDLQWFGSLPQVLNEADGLIVGQPLSTSPPKEEKVLHLHRSLGQLAEAGAVAPFPVSYGGAVPDWMRTVAAFDAHQAADAAATQSRAAVALDSKRTENQVTAWLCTVIRTDGLPGPLAGQVLAEWQESLATRIITLREFGGDREALEVEFTPVETRFLNLLRDDWEEGSYFDEEREPDPMVRGTNLWDSLQQDTPRTRALRAAGEELDAVITVRYHERFTPEQIEAYMKGGRTTQLFRLALEDASTRLDLDNQERSQILGNLIRVSNRLEELGAFQSEVLDEGVVEKESELVQAGYRYYLAALPNNPQFKNLSENRTGQEMFDAYRSYLNLGEETLAEREARETLLSELGL